MGSLKEKMETGNNLVLSQMTIQDNGYHDESDSTPLRTASPLYSVPYFSLPVQNAGVLVQSIEGDRRDYLDESRLLRPSLNQGKSLPSPASPHSYTPTTQTMLASLLTNPMLEQIAAQISSPQLPENAIDVDHCWTSDPTSPRASLEPPAPEMSPTSHLATQLLTLLSLNQTDCIASNNETCEPASERQSEELNLSPSPNPAFCGVGRTPAAINPKCLTDFQLQQVRKLVPRDPVTGKLLSIGSLAHVDGTCKPCVFANHETKKCVNEELCLFCHCPHEPKKRSRVSRRRRKEEAQKGIHQFERPFMRLPRPQFTAQANYSFFHQNPYWTAPNSPPALMHGSPSPILQTQWSPVIQQANHIYPFRFGQVAPGKGQWMKGQWYPPYE